ncbi:tetratricopeptide repeat protein [Paractinoplanes atraurantiacus]|uniref:Uncharacterized protein n=1 Tax=Paractinoplanes atraurantiacus TaxID=1036182 RepID=A0A285J1Q8_9ACTN|nr:tetratricopeptide repeat protein [Actinoplanes atraurantiacus]SNY54255.1 hypothetical protein SAMN05421748_11531 [Actinoplanes atraurantiacus]
MAKRRRSLVLAAGPIVGALIGALTNIATTRWNWWLIAGLAALVGVAVAIVVATDASPAAPAARGRNLLPRDLTDFTGRAKDLDRIVSARSPIYSVDGMGGIGKTSLAVHAAHRLADSYPGAQVFLDLRGFSEGEPPLPLPEALEILLLAVGVPADQIPAATAARVNLWRAELGARKAVVVLDNAAGADQVRPLLPGASSSLVIVTSRRRLFDLDGVETVSLDVLSPAEASELFRIVLGRPAPDAASIVARLGHLPLAIRLAAAWLRHHPELSGDDLMRRLDTPLASVREVFLLAYRALDEPARKALALVAFAPTADVTADSAAALLRMSPPETQAVLDALCDRNLLSEPVAGRFTIHDLVRESVMRHGEFAGLRADAIGDLMRHYRDAGAGTPVMADLSWWHAEIDNIVMCARHAIQAEEHPFTWELPLTAAQYLRVRDRIALLSDLLQAAEAATDDPAVSAEILRELGICAWLTGRYADATILTTRALETFTAVGDPMGCAHAVSNLGRIDKHTGDLASARVHLQDALGRYDELGDTTDWAAIQLLLCALDRKGGDLGAARARADAALKVAVETGQRDLEADARTQAGTLDRLEGRYTEARRNFERALALDEEMGDRLQTAYVHRHFARLETDLSAFTEARNRLGLALGIYLEIESSQGVADTHQQLSELAERAGDKAAARRHRAKALEMSRVLGRQKPEPGTLSSAAAG